MKLLIFLTLLNLFCSSQVFAGDSVVIMTTRNDSVKILVDWTGSGSLAANGVELINDIKNTIATVNDSVVLIATGDVQLTHLNCQNNDLTGLDITNCLKLTELDCFDNYLHTLDVTKCTELTYLRCTSNSLSVLDVTKCTKLTLLDCSNNLLSTLNVTKCPEITKLTCFNNKLTELDITNCLKLTELSCFKNYLRTLDVTKCAELTYLWCHENFLSVLDITNCPKLKFLRCSYNSLSVLDITRCPELSYLECNNNSLSVLDLTKSPEMTQLYCSNNSLFFLDITNCPKLNNLHAIAQTLTLPVVWVDDVKLSIKNPVAGAKIKIFHINYRGSYTGDSITWEVMRESGKETFEFSIETPNGISGVFGGTVTQPWTKTKPSKRLKFRKRAQYGTDNVTTGIMLKTSEYSGDVIPETVQVEKSDIQEDEALYDRLGKLIYGGELDSVKSIVEAYNIDFSKDDRYRINRIRLVDKAAHIAHYDIFLFLAQLQPETYNWQSTLNDAISGGNLDIVKYIVEVKGADVSKASIIEKAVSDRHSGKRRQSFEVIEYLISKGAELTDINDGNDIFFWAMEHSSDSMMAFLVEKGIEVDMNSFAPGKWPPSEGGWTPLAMALDERKFALAKLLLKRTDNYTFRELPLVNYFADGEPDSPAIIEFLIEEGINKEHYTRAFIKSVINNDSVSAQLLLDAGADISSIIEVNAKGMYEGNSNILHYASEYEMAKFLIRNGADIHNEIMLKNAWRDPPLLCALEEVGVYPSISQENLNIVLANAAQNDDIRAVEYALKRGADVNSYRLPPIPEEESDWRWYESVYKQTPLVKNIVHGYQHCEYYRNRSWKETISSDVVEKLLEAGADPDIIDANGKAALHYAAGDKWWCSNKHPLPTTPRNFWERHRIEGQPSMELSHNAVVRLLIDSGADLNIQDNNGNTPLISAAKIKNYEALTVLIDAKADISIRNNDGESMFRYLSYHDYLRFLVSPRGLPEADASRINVSPELLETAKMILSELLSKKQLNAEFSKLFTGYYLQSKSGIEELKSLIRFGADVNLRINKKRALRIAKEQNNKEVIDILLEAGAK